VKRLLWEASCTRFSNARRREAMMRIAIIYVVHHVKDTSVYLRSMYLHREAQAKQVI